MSGASERANEGMNKRVAQSGFLIILDHSAREEEEEKKSIERALNQTSSSINIDYEDEGRDWFAARSVREKILRVAYLGK